MLSDSLFFSINRKLKNKISTYRGMTKKCPPPNLTVFQRFLFRKWLSDVVSTTIRFVFEFRVDWWYFCPTIMKISLSPPQNDEFFGKILCQFTIVIWPQFKVGKNIKDENQAKNKIFLNFLLEICPKMYFWCVWFFWDFSWGSKSLLKRIVFWLILFYTQISNLL